MWWSNTITCSFDIIFFSCIYYQHGTLLKLLQLDFFGLVLFIYISLLKSIWLHVYKVAPIKFWISFIWYIGEILFQRRLCMMYTANKHKERKKYLCGSHLFVVFVVFLGCLQHTQAVFMHKWLFWHSVKINTYLINTTLVSINKHKLWFSHPLIFLEGNGPLTQCCDAVSSLTLCCLPPPHHVSFFTLSQVAMR